MTKFLKKNWYYIVIFIFIYLVYSVLSFANNYGDPIANYGFSYGITRGLLPYKDFNIISTPLYAFMMSIGLFIWNNYSMFLLEQTLLVTILFYLLEKVYGKKCFIVLFVIACLLFLGINATYNYCCLFFMVVLLFLENKYKDKDYLIGIVLGLAILSKHTIGGLFIIPSIIYYFKNKDKLLKRFLGLLTVGIIFIIYLLISNSFNEFIDLCILGLFDFSSKNGQIKNVYFYTGIIMFIISLIITIKNRKDIKNYYLLCGIGFMIPLFDLCHFSFYAQCFTMQLLPFIKKKENYLGILSIILSMASSITLAIRAYNSIEPVLNKDFKAQAYIFNTKYNYTNTMNMFKVYDEYPDALILSYGKMDYDIYKNRDIDYFSVLLYGNYGYDGSNKMINKIKKMKDTYIIIEKKSYNDSCIGSQFEKTVVD